MNEKLISQPNWHSEIYRTLRPNLDITVLENYLDFVEVSKDGHVLLGSSNLTGRTWFGSVWYYENIDLACKLTSYVANKSIPSGVTDGKFLPDTSKVLIVDDSGIIQLMSLPDNGDSPDDKLQPQIIAEEHESGITEISLLPNGRQFLTSSMDCSVKLWDLERTRPESCEYFDALRTYAKAHRDAVTSVCSHNVNDDLFITCSADRDALLWDMRIDEKPAMAIYENNFCGLTNVKWHPLQENLVAIAAESGVIYLVDLRDPYQFLTKINGFDKCIYRLRFNNAGYLAACADTNRLVVINAVDIHNLKIIYEDEKHEDMIRGLAWISNNQLLTCGWNKNIFQHHVIIKE